MNLHNYNSNNNNNKQVDKKSNDTFKQSRHKLKLLCKSADHLHDIHKNVLKKERKQKERCHFQPEHLSIETCHHDHHDMFQI